MEESFNPRQGRRRIKHHAPVIVIAIVGVLVSVSVWSLTAASETRAFVAEFAGRSNNLAFNLQNGIDDYRDNLQAVHALFDSSPNDVTREQFETFTNSLINSHGAILNIAWFPRVRRDERAAREHAAVRDGVPDYHIRTVGPGESLPISPERDEYFPKFYSTDARNSPVYGLDLNDGGARERTLNHIRDSGELSSSPPLLLRTGKGDRLGFWAGLPVYAHGLPHATVEDRRRNLLGVILGVFQTGAMIKAITSGVKSPGRLYVFAPGAAADTLSIYAQSRLGAGAIAAVSQQQLAAGLHWSFSLRFGDVEWTLVVASDDLRILAAERKGSWIVLICGLVLTGGLTSFVWAMRRYARRIETVNDRFEKQNVRFDAALNNMAQGLLMYNRVGKLVTSNRRFAELFGMPWDKWTALASGTTIAGSMQIAHELTNVTEKNQTQIVSELKKIVEGRNAGKIIFERTDERTFSASCAPMPDGGLVATFEDITENRRTEKKIAHMAHYDALTDLPNRTAFYKRMDALLDRAPLEGTFAVFSLDLDGFKSVNDTLGHPIGDRLLQAVADRMRGCIRDTDIIARLGGDEFAIVQVEFDDASDVTALAARLIAAVNAPYRLDGHQVVVGTSIGIAIAPGDGTEADRLIKNADLALYRSKADGGSTYRFFEARMDARMRERRALEADLRVALENQEFSLDYQPIFNLKTGKVSSCEALIRWHQPERGLVPPLEFIAIAEKTGLINSIGEWVLRTACTEAVGWPGGCSVAVNVSPVQFKSADFIGIVVDALETSGLPAGRLELEITELVLMQDSELTVGLLHRLKKLGIRIAMDDFGTGYSSLGYLRSFPFDKIKIDQSFIHDLSNNKDSLAILCSVVSLGRSLGIVTTAEGVEAQNQLDVLRTEGCTEAQGFLFSRPRSAAETSKMLSSLDRGVKAVA
jgi:diguanylate cyclase (GGDEF)-like protein